MKRFNIETDSKTDEKFTIVDGNTRISVLSPCLVRVERGEFCDEPTQKVWYRNWDRPKFDVERRGASIAIVTEKARFVYNTKLGRMTGITPFGGKKLSFYGIGNLKGTRRTLDGCDGAVPLGKGVTSKRGVAVMDDGKSLILRKDRIVQRGKCSDKYYFAYGRDYRGCIRDFFRLCGEVPLIPRFALGNWWSRYKAYTQREYLTLMRRFKDEKIPFTVATIDMDWHWVDVVRRFGSEARPKASNLLDAAYAASMPGWTGYSWNTELFPDHKAMLDELNGMGYRVTLNVHPSSGVRFFEDMYDRVCAVVGEDPKEKKQIRFSLADDNFLRAYFDEIHRPYEREGVAFWWIDWQQGKKSDVPGLDPLWALNHYHFLDRKDSGDRALILSRYAGEGSHRYPLGFSGDSAMTWRSLRFQPYMTSTAANVGYTWWSHDIGGHHMGIKDDELYVRWLQFGVFSPVNRLHSTSNEFMGKEPWKCGRYAELIADGFLRLRHRLIPYIYSENYATHAYGKALCEPMYYGWERPEAYKAKGQYMFGSQLLVCPITRRTDPDTSLAYADVWIPEGVFTDVFTGNRYAAGKYRVYRELNAMPVFAKEGAIVPMYSDVEDNDVSSEKDLDILIYRGEGRFVLYDDDGRTTAHERGEYAGTEISVATVGDTLRLGITHAFGDKKQLPEGRKFTLIFKDVVSADVEIDGRPAGSLGSGVTVEYRGEPVTVALRGCEFSNGADYGESVVDLVSRYRMGNIRKKRIFSGALKSRTSGIFAAKRFRGPVEELRAVCGSDKDDGAV